MSDLFYTALKEKYKQYFVNDLLAFAKETIDRTAFPPLLIDLYHNDTGRGRKAKRCCHYRGEGPRIPLSSPQIQDM
jgi:hypothetical protein